jgi:hypothetical protein
MKSSLLGERQLQNDSRYFMDFEYPETHIICANISGEFTRHDIIHFKLAIDAELSQRPHVTHLIFDAVKIDPIYNAAGRLLDLTFFYRIKGQLKVHIKLPADTYGKLQKLTPGEMKPMAGGITTVRKVTVEAVPLPAESNPITKDNLKAFLEKLVIEYGPYQPETLLRCVGKIRTLNGSNVTVSLFLDEGEILGEFNISQFPRKELAPGTVFDYEAAISSPGITEIKIDLRPDQEPSDDDLMDLVREIGSINPLKDVEEKTVKT